MNLPLVGDMERCDCGGPRMQDPIYEMGFCISAGVNCDGEAIAIGILQHRTNLRLAALEIAQIVMPVGCVHLGRMRRAYLIEVLEVEQAALLEAAQESLVGL